jgi:hypothetical protein
MAERCRLCGTGVRVADATHVMINSPETGVRDCYVCPLCFEGSIAPIFSNDGDDRGVSVGGEDDRFGDHRERDNDLATPE